MSEYIAIYTAVSLSIFGVYMLVLDRLKLATIQTSKNINLFLKQKKRNKLEIFLDDLASKLARLITIDEYKKNQLNTKLKMAGIYKTPERYMAACIIKAVLPVLIICPVAAIKWPVLFVPAAVAAVTIYFREITSLDKDLKIIRAKIEYEIPRFTRNIAEHLKSDRNVLLMLERYKNTAGEELKKELEITTTDMKTGNYERALSRLEARVQSPMLSDVVRGLIAVMRGDDSQFYFQILAHDFKVLELERLKAEATQRPGKIKKYSFLLLGCMMLMYIVIISMAVIQSMEGMF